MDKQAGRERETSGSHEVTYLRKKRHPWEPEFSTKERAAQSLRKEGERLHSVKNKHKIAATPSQITSGGFEGAEVPTVDSPFR